MFHAIGIISKPRRPDVTEIVPELMRWLKGRGLTYQYDLETAQTLGVKGGHSREELAASSDLLIVLGGDGTLLSAARASGAHDLPLLAVNLGGLGFLMTTGPHELYTVLDRVLQGHFNVQCRTMLRAEVRRDGKVAAQYDALNDIVITKAAMARLIEIDAYVDSEFMCGFRGDGLILATPTGSTAYSLAAGGPVIIPAVAAICITPICPHSFTNRPVLLPDTSTVELVVTDADDSSFLTVDGQVGVGLRGQDRIRCFRSPHRVHLVQAERPLFFEVLRTKMKWGER